MKVILGLLFLFTFAAYNTASSDEGQIRVVAKSMRQWGSDFISILGR